VTINSIYAYVLDLWRKDHKGVVLPPPVFNNWIAFVSLDMFENIFTQAQQLAAQGNRDVSDVILKLGVFGNFVKDVNPNPAQQPIAGVNVGYIEIPTDFRYALGMIADGNIITIKSPTMKAKYRGAVVNGDIGNNPVAFVEDKIIEFLPNDLGKIVLIYLRKPAVPYYDYCMDSRDQQVFMPVGSICKKDDALITNLYKSGGVTVITAGVTANGPLPYTSLTTELDWDESQHTKIADQVAQKLGVNLRIMQGGAKQ